ncbi:MAG TPA: hypothetical protein VNJ08_12420 [Bacteriovoracaceae bacterium]|nr:hypothetical protein [Bacteriovoracaceae bacterium]
MGLVFWIDQNEIATKLFEKVFKERGLPFYTISSVSDFSYLIADLNPELLVLDAETALKDLNRLKQQYEATEGFQGKPVILINALPGLEFISNVIGEIKRPINPFQLPDQLNKMTIDL